MVITYYGISCFKIQSGDITLVFDLPSKKSSTKPPRFQADIFVQSHNHDGHNGAESIEREKEFFFISDPGEYEVKGVYVHGLKSFHDFNSGKKHGINNVYVVRLENINLCFLGDFGEKELRPELKEGIGKIDILFIPIGADTVLDPEGARNIINQIEPSIAVPMHYSPASGEGKKRDLLKQFLAELGQKDIKPQEKLSIKKKDIIEDKGAQVVLLSPL